MKKYFFISIILFIFIFISKVKADENIVKINETLYSSLQEAVDATKSNDELVLLTDIDISSQAIMANFPDNVTLNLNNHQITLGFMGLIFTGNNLTIKNGTFSSIADYSLWVGDVIESQNVLIENVTTYGGINVYNATGVVLRNVNSTGRTYYAVWADNGAEVTVESGLYKTEGIYGLVGISDNPDAPHSMTLLGGTYELNNDKLFPGAIVPTIYGGTFNADITEYLPEDVEFTIRDGKYVVNEPKVEEPKIEEPEKNEEIKVEVIENPNTYDNGMISIIITFVSFVALSGSIFIFKRTVNN